MQFATSVALAWVLPGSAAQAAGGGVAALAAATPVVDLVAETQPAEDGLAAECTLGTPSACFENAVPARQINVASFFDRLQRNTSTHVMAKYYEPPAGARVQIEGFSFVANQAAEFAAAGVLVTERDNPLLPSTEQLRNLQALRFRSTAGGPTCVDVHARLVVLEPGQAAWLVVVFPDFVTTATTVTADPDPANDQPCDFLSRDSGELWLRPNPANSPFDWKFTAFTTPVTSKLDLEWTTYKRLYR